MLRVYPASWIAAFMNLERQCWRLTSLMGLEMVPAEVDEALAKFSEMLQKLIDRSDDVPLSLSMRSQMRRLSEKVLETEPHRYTMHHLGVLNADAENLMRNLTMELHEYLFLAVSSQWRELYEDPQSWFGLTAVQKFQGVERDVRDACQCFALGQWTATVFHCMGILEVGLRSLAADLALPNVEYEDWKNILDQIEKKIKAMEQERKTAERIERVRYYSEAASQFRLFKDAFRNHVSHHRSHASYDEQDAKKILDGVRDFMLALAKKPS